MRVGANLYKAASEAEENAKRTCLLFRSLSVVNKPTKKVDLKRKIHGNDCMFRHTQLLSKTLHSMI
jgi:hypothetical protein